MMAKEPSRNASPVQALQSDKDPASAAEIKSPDMASIPAPIAIENGIEDGSAPTEDSTEGTRKIRSASTAAKEAVEKKTKEDDEFNILGKIKLLM